MEDSKDYDNLKAELDCLKNALPDLPDSNTLYAHIVDLLLKIHAMKISVTNLGAQVDHFCKTMEEESNRPLRIELLQTAAWKTQYQLLLYETRLDDLLIYPKLMIATKNLDEKVWTEMMAQPLLDIDEKPVNTDFSQVKREIQTHLQTIEKIFRQLELLDDEVGRKEYIETKKFEIKVLKELTAIQEKLDHMHIHVGRGKTVRPGGGVSSDLSLHYGIDFNYPYYSDSEHSDEKEEATEEKTLEEGTHRSAGKEGPRDLPKLVDPDELIDSDRSIGSREQESARIQENVAFLEPLLGEEVNIDFKDQQAMEVEELVEVDDALGEEEETDSDVMIIPQEEVRPREIEVVQEEPVRLRRQENEEELIQRLRREYRQAIQAREDLRMMMRELETPPRCPTRNFNPGMKHENEAEMPCVFCGMRGHHYSDSCIEFITVESRLERLAEVGRCRVCLDTWCDESREKCRKFNARCHYCGGYGHNACICELPEIKRKLQEKFEWLNRDYANVNDRIARLAGRLQRHGAL